MLRVFQLCFQLNVQSRLKSGNFKKELVVFYAFYTNFLLYYYFFFQFSMTVGRSDLSNIEKNFILLFCSSLSSLANLQNFFFASQPLLIKLCFHFVCKISRTHNNFERLGIAPRKNLDLLVTKCLLNADIGFFVYVFDVFMLQLQLGKPASLAQCLK